MEKPTREHALLREGWTKQFLASGSRLQEAVELYQSMGFEVHLEPARLEDLACSKCHVDPLTEIIEGSYVIYTRPRQGAGDDPRCKEELRRSYGEGYGEKTALSESAKK